MWFSVVYWSFSLLYLSIEPVRRFGHKREYPDYRWYDSVSKVTPYLLASVYYCQPSFALLVVADLAFDGVYLTGDESWFKYGLAFWTAHHLSFVEEPWIIVLAIVTTVGICIIYGSKWGYLMYVFAILRHFEWPLSKTIGIVILGTGDVLLAWSRNHRVPHKDMITMLSSYIYVYLTSCNLVKTH